MELEKKIHEGKKIEDGTFKIITSEKYDETYIQDLQNTKMQLQETYENGMELLDILKELKIPYCIQPSIYEMYEAFSEKRSKAINERNKTFISNYLNKIYDEVKNKGISDKVSITFGYKFPEILSLVDEIEIKLDKIMKISDDILNMKY